MKRRNRQPSGFTLIELMIALTLGSLLLAAAISFAVSNSHTRQMNDSLGRIQENAMAALDILAEDLRLAGHHHHVTDQVDILPVHCLQANSTAAPCVVNNRNPQDDVLLVQYQVPTTRAQDCTGKKLTAGSGLIVNTYSIQDPDGDGVNTLYCRGFSVDGHHYLSNSTPLVDGIDAMRVFYRVSRDADGSRYRRFSRLSASDLRHISAVSITLLVSNGLQDGMGKSRSRRYPLPGNEEIIFSADTHYRLLFKTTITLDNQLGALRL